MAYDVATYLPDDIMVKVDRAAMASSLETRAPFLDHRIVAFAMRQPLSSKIQGTTGKLLLRKLLARYVPAEMFERPKRGFAVPINHWLRGPLRPWVNDTLADDAVMRDWFNGRYLRRLWTAHLSGQSQSQRLWPALVLLQWLRAR